MRKCCGNDWSEWGPDSIFEIECKSCGHMVEFFKDEITRNCPKCKAVVINNSKDYGCGQWCSANSPHQRNLCSKFKKSKQLFYGNSMPKALY